MPDDETVALLLERVDDVVRRLTAVENLLPPEIVSRTLDRVTTLERNAQSYGVRVKQMAEWVENAEEGRKIQASALGKMFNKVRAIDRSFDGIIDFCDEVGARLRALEATTPDEALESLIAHSRRLEERLTEANAELDRRAELLDRYSAAATHEATAPPDLRGAANKVFGALSRVMRSTTQWYTDPALVQTCKDALAVYAAALAAAPRPEPRCRRCGTPEAKHPVDDHGRKVPCFRSPVPGIVGGVS